MNEVNKYYLDTSALLPYYREEKVSRRIQELLSDIQPPVMISSLTKVEFASALARWVRMEEITDVEANLIENTFNGDIKMGLFIRHPLSPAHFSQAETWLLNRKTALRTLDALHLACSWSLKAELITCDNILQGSADILGIKSRII
jgi:predicted nucleic acid-binding protein